MPGYREYADYSSHYEPEQSQKLEALIELTRSSSHNKSPTDPRNYESIEL